eukprot:515323_1
MAVSLAIRHKKKWIRHLKVGDKLDVREWFGWGREECWLVYEFASLDYDKKVVYVYDRYKVWNGIRQTIEKSWNDIAPLYTYTLNEIKLLEPTSNYLISNAINYKFNFIMLNDSYIYAYNLNQNRYNNISTIDIGENGTWNNIISCDEANDTLWIFDTKNAKLTLVNIRTQQLKYYIFNKNIESISINESFFQVFKRTISSFYNSSNNITVPRQYNYWKHHTALNDVVSIFFVHSKQWRECKYRTFFIPTPFHQFHIIQACFTYGENEKCNVITINHIVFHIIDNKWKQYQFVINYKDLMPGFADILYVSKLTEFVMFCHDIHGKTSVWKLHMDILKNLNNINCTYLWKKLDIFWTTEIRTGGNSFPMFNNVIGFDYIIFSLSGNDGILCYDSWISNKWYKSPKYVCFDFCPSICGRGTSLVRNGNYVHLIQCHNGYYDGICNERDSASRHLKISLCEMIPNELMLLYTKYFEICIFGYVKDTNANEKVLWYRNIISLIIQYIVSQKRYKWNAKLRRKKKRKKFKYCNHCMVQHCRCVKLKVCARCKAVYYCGRLCQKIEWKRKHRFICC